MNPFRDGLGYDQVKKMSPRLPDNTTSDTAMLTLTSAFTFSSATAQKGFITPCPPVYGASPLLLFYGGDADSGSSSPTAFTCPTTGPPELTMFDSIVTSTGKMRVVACGLKVNCVSSGDSVAGTLTGGNWSGNLFGTNVATFTTYSECLKSTDAIAMEVKDGITVRAKYDDNTVKFNTYPAAAYGGTAGQQFAAFGLRPFVKFSGLTSAAPYTQLLIQAVWFVEVQVLRNACPIPLVEHIYEKEYQEAISWMNTQPFYTSGHSFKSVFNSIGRAAKQAFKFLTDHPEAMATVKLASKALL
jgi:hypothetical protein